MKNTDLKVDDLKLFVNDFSNKSQNVHHRYRSFDFCYSHFYLSKHGYKKVDIQESCYVLWSYLASWGMLRGSSFLLDKNPSHLKKVVEFIYSQDKIFWKIDVPDYDKKIDDIIKIYNGITDEIAPDGNRHLVLVTKVMLGVFGIVPAYDTFFSEIFSLLSSKRKDRKYCGFTSFNENSLNFIHEFYLANQAVIDELQQSHDVYDFNGDKTKTPYKKAKIIDMYGFKKGYDLAESRKPVKKK